MQKIILTIVLILGHAYGVKAQLYDEYGNDVTGGYGQNQYGNNNFNPHNTDSAKSQKIVPKGIYVWSVDRKFGDVIPADVDTLPHLFTHETLNTGKYGQFNTTGNNYSARQNRIFMERPTQDNYPLVDAYSYVLKQPDQVHFTNTLSPITNLWYDNCGNKTNGEDHIDAKFAVNAGKRIGMGFDINYAYARGYYQNQNISHFASTLYLSYLGDKYQLHTIFSTNHQKATENGGITNDDYITHTEIFSESYASNEIPTSLSYNWNRNHNYHFFLTHRYNLGFYREEMMTEDEIKAKKFADEAQKEKEQKESAQKGGSKSSSTPQGRPDGAKVSDVPLGRPDDAVIAGEEPAIARNETSEADTTRIAVTSKEESDSLMALQAEQDSLAQYMKKVFVPVTSFIHTLELDNYDRIYQAYRTPDDYYANTFFNVGPDGYPGDSIYDKQRHFQIKNTAALALLEGFNKWAKSGLKVFATHHLRRYEMPTINEGGSAVNSRWTEHNVSIGTQLLKTQGHTLHYKATGELWTAGEDIGQVKVDFHTDLNFPIFGDTVTLAANAYFYRLNPDFFFRHFHSKHIWWDNTSLDKTTRTRIQGNFSYAKTKTNLKVGIEEMQNYTYLAMSYDYSANGVTNMAALVNQHSGNINVLSAQLDQPLSLGPVHWDNVITYQSSSNQSALPLPSLNVFSNLYLKFVYAHVLSVEIGAAATYFTKYYAPDFCPQLNQYAVQQNSDSKIELGNHPFVDIYANFHLKHARFFLMLQNLTGDSMNRMNFLTPHYPQNASVLHFGISWNFFN